MRGQDPGVWFIAAALLGGLGLAGSSTGCAEGAPEQGGAELVAGKRGKGHGYGHGKRPDAGRPPGVVDGGAAPDACLDAAHPPSVAIDAAPPPVAVDAAAPPVAVDAAGPSPSGGYFPAGAVWSQDISDAPLDAESAAVIAGLDRAGGWGSGTMRIDFSIEVLQASPDDPLRTFTTTGDFWSPDCDHVPVPVPAGGALEGETGYECAHDGDCHLIVVNAARDRLYEMWRADLSGGTFRGGCLAVWDLTRIYGPWGRGRDCTSADAAGYPIAPLLFSADEVAAGHIDHAIRFILPNTRIRHRRYVHPATHSTGVTSGGTDTPPYGARFRLRADYPIDILPAGARVVARALQTYGMFLADGGTIALTAQSDRFTTAKWAGRLDPYSLSALRVTDFEMVAAGTRYTFTGDCVREP